jgi:hypothetical protein
MCGIFLLIYNSLPGESGWIKGLSYGLIMWFFRVLMHVVSLYMTIRICFKTLAYILISGLIEMIFIGIFFGLTISG